MTSKYSRRNEPSSTSDALHTAKQVTQCPFCENKKVIRKGMRKNKYGDVQLYYCRRCERKFTPLLNKHRTFPLRVIMDALTLYNRLYSLQEAADKASEKYGLTITRQTVANWRKAFKEYLPFLRLRTAAVRRFPPHKIITEAVLLHGLTYRFKYHRAKMALIVKGNHAAHSHTRFAPLGRFLENLPHECPHEIFREMFRKQTPRASTHRGRFNLDGVIITPRQNAAVKAARFVLQAVADNKRRHDILQDFMLCNDSVTVAVEVPVMLRADDLKDFEERGYQVPITLARDEVITGHIDIVQIRYGLIHILDYKPGARKVKPIEQLMIYALALSRATGIGLYYFKCAWFDDEDYFEFYPRSVVRKS